MSIPTQTPAWEEQAPLLVDVCPLPPIMSGIHEIKTHLRLTDDFLRTWMESGSKSIPAIPHFMIGYKPCFPTRAVLAWLSEHHGYGGGMRSPTLKPKLKRAAPRKATL